MTDLPCIVCCIESGPLEHQTVRFVESLRRWGGTFTGAEVVAVTPRFGPPLRKETLAALSRHGVEHLKFRAKSPYIWQHYMNKPLAIAAVAARTTASTVAWFDSDILVIGEPDLIALAPDEDFCACARDRGIGTTGPDDPRHAYWLHVCDVAGVELDELPWVVTEGDQERIRLYWNSGLFTFRVDSGMADDYLSLNVDLLDSRVGTVTNKHQYTDQVALGLSMARLDMRWRALPHAYNYGVSRWHPDEPSKLAETRVVHFHDSLSPDFFDEFVRRLRVDHPEVAEWIAAVGPLPDRGVTEAATAQLLRLARSGRRRRFYAQSRWL